jgi:DNA-binding NarL/FixJ family response regulator
MAASHRILLIGDSLFAESLTQLLESSGSITIVGSVATIEEALPLIPQCRPDAVVMADVVASQRTHLGPLLELYEDLPILCADLSTNYVLVITSRRIEAQRAGFLAALEALPSRSV